MKCLRPHPGLLRAGVLILALAGAVPWPARAADNIAAVWEPHEIKFHYGGFTSYYTCDGIRDKLKVLLRALGARHDVKTQSTCLGDRWDPQPFNTVIIGFAVPVPASQAGRGGPGETFPAEWRQVELTAGHPRDLDHGDCELVEQFAEQVLVKLHARDIENRMRCIPHQENLGNIRLKMRVLMAVQIPKKGNK